MLKKLVICAFLGTAALAILVHAENQSGFISIDCGIPANSGYTDKMTGISYTSDATFTDTGASKIISPEYNRNILEQQFLNVRSFPEGKRNCYTLKPDRHKTKFLIRARFMYGNYDGNGKVPSFNLLLGPDVWDSVKFVDASTIITKEIIHIPQNQNNNIYVCLENTGSGTPFISAIELRPLENSTYSTVSQSLLLLGRWDVGSTTNKTFRYKDDIYDRIWSPYNSYNWRPISNSLKVYSLDDYAVPSSVLQTAAVPANGSNSLQITLKPTDPNFKYYFYFYFAEVEENQYHQSRELNVYVNGRNFIMELSPHYLIGITVRSEIPLSEEKIEFSINKTENSTLPPILNAFETYREKEFLQLLTDQQDVDAIMNIKSKYGVNRDWQGDPCSPEVYLWQGLNCSYDDYNPPRIISLNLSSSGIAGDIDPHISGLTSIQILDLSYNNLTGTVPDFLSQLPFLRALNLTGNKLKGSVPTGLVERKNNNLLLLSVDENPDLCPEDSCAEKNNFVVPVLAAALSFSVLLSAMAILLILKTRQQVGKKNDGSLVLENLRFTYFDVVRITNNFERVLGKGGFGTVYHGYLDDTQVAVKMLSPSSVQGYKQFQAEVKLLMRVHHKNLTTLVGYCDEGINMGLIYEFMANGNLETHLLAQSDADILDWEGRLRIATEAAQGLEYLHNGCKPPIVHRDVKSTNILLNENFQAKLSDFGLSRIFPIEGGTHVSTAVAGTPGYLDPEYYISNRLIEKSDVYSFGVVLLEIITCKPVIEKSLERTHITQWVSFMLTKADIRSIVDPRLQGEFDINSVRKAVEIAMACISPTATKRPTMTQVVIELNECLATEIARKKVVNEIQSKDSTELSDIHAESSDIHAESSLSARLIEKSDVYSFGVVLLIIITCKSVIEKSLERTHITQWVSFMLAKADSRNIVDPRLQGEFDINSVRKAIEIAMACISPIATKRPTMTQVVIELNERLATEIARKKVINETQSKDSTELSNIHAESSLSARL